MQSMLYIHWDVDPTIFGFFSWYGLLFASSFAVGYWLMLRVFRTEKIDPYYLESLTIYMGISTVVGARLGHCLFYDPAYYFSHPWEILMVWNGGLASHGAAIGIVTGLVLWSRKVSKRSPWWILDRVVIMVALSGLFIRSGNLMNSEILGSPTESSMGFVFPRADQADGFRAKWIGEDVEIDYAPGAMASQYFSIFRIAKDNSVVEVKGEVQQTKLNGENAFKMLDRGAGKSPKNYLVVGRGKATVSNVIATDSTKTTDITASHEFAPSLASISGEWVQDKIKLHFEVRGLKPDASLPLIFMQQVDGQRWDLVGRGTLGSSSGMASFDTLVVPPPGAKSVQYHVFEKDSEILLTARHPGMMYEAFAYTAIFFLLWWIYEKRKGKIARGQFFGIFLIMVFGARILIEFMKEDQEAFNLGLPLNMGQLLSVPFVLYGIYCVLKARQIGYVEEPDFPPVPENAKESK